MKPGGKGNAANKEKSKYSIDDILQKVSESGLSRLYRRAVLNMRFSQKQDSRTVNLCSYIIHMLYNPFTIWYYKFIIMLRRINRRKYTDIILRSLHLLWWCVA